jgi:hypothetical protein
LWRRGDWGLPLCGAEAEEGGEISKVKMKTKDKGKLQIY